MVLVTRFVGGLQFTELALFDRVSRHCSRIPSQSEPVVVVGVTEADLQAFGEAQVNDQSLNQVVQQLSAAGTSVIGLNLFRDLPVEPGHGDWSNTLKRSLQASSPDSASTAAAASTSASSSPLPAIIASEVSLNGDPNLNVAPPPELPSDRVGFVDVVMDADGHLRRSLLLARDWDGNLKQSLALRLTQQYLQSPRQQSLGQPLEQQLSQPWQMDPLERSSDPIVFRPTEASSRSNPVALPRMTAQWGGYVRTMSQGNQLLLNFCHQQSPPPFLTFGEVLRGQFEPEQVRDRVVLIGMTAASVKDVLFTNALRETRVVPVSPDNAGPTLATLMYGVEYHAYATRQMIQTVQAQQPLLRVWPEGIEYGAILLLGVLGIGLGIVIRSPIGSLIALIGASGVVVLGCVVALWLGWWLPVFPMLLAIAGAGLTTTLFDRDAQFELRQRRLGVEQTYSAIHNGPLQQLARMVRQAEEQRESLDAVRVGGQLRSLDQSLRDIYEHMRHEGTSRRSLLYINGEFMSLEEPLPELLYQVYNLVLMEEMPGLDCITDFVPPDFSPLRGDRFGLEERRGLCQFLQEALLHIGHQTQNATSLAVICGRQGNRYRLGLYHDGESIHDEAMPDRRQAQAQAAAKALRGRFRRTSAPDKGTVDELVWVAKSQFLPWRRSPKQPRFE